MAGIPGLGDRATMERERLARLAARGSPTVTGKRGREISPPVNTRPTKLTKLVDDSKSGQDKTPGETTKARGKMTARSEVIVLDSPSPPRAQAVASSSGQSRQATPTTANPLAYPNGAIKKTWAFKHSRNGNDIKIEEVLEKNTLRTAVLSAFQWDADWIAAKLMPSTKCIYIMQAKEQSMREQMLEETKDMRHRLRLCFPPMDGQINCMHSKLMLLFHPHKLRVAIPSANLTDYDWGESGIMENSVFLIDLPRVPEGGARTLTPFAQELLFFLEKQGLDEDVRQGVLNFDFGATAHIAFVHSSGGVHYGDDMRRTGCMGLDKAVKQLGLVTEPDLEIDYAASSIGSLNNDQLRNIHTAARGGFPNTLAPKTSKKGQGDGGNAQGSPGIRDLVRIYFPSLATVAGSKGGVDNGGTICFQRRWWEGENRFPRDCFRDHVGRRAGLLSHNKLLYARGRRHRAVASSSSSSSADADADADADDVAWVYMGSANVSESAWGKLVWDARRKEWKLNCKNWECGVVVRVPADTLSGAPREHVQEQQQQQSDAETDDGSDPQIGRSVVSMDVFGAVIEPPFEYPGRRYDEGMEPWYFTEPHPNVNSRITGV